MDLGDDYRAGAQLLLDISRGETEPETRAELLALADVFQRLTDDAAHVIEFKLPPGGGQKDGVWRELGRAIKPGSLPIACSRAVLAEISKFSAPTHKTKGSRRVYVREKGLGR